MPRTHPGDSQREHDEFEARTDALIQRLGGRVDNPHRDAGEFLFLDIQGHARDFHAKRNERVPDGLRAMFANEVEAHQRGLGTDDLPALVENVYGKLTTQGYVNAPVSYPLWTSAGSVENYREARAVGVSAHPTLGRISELGEIPLADRSDRAEPFTVHRYAARTRFTDDVLFGDNANLLVREPLEHGRSARMTIQREVSNLLKLASGTGPTLNATGNALFSAAHGNYTNPGAAPTVTTLDVARAAMRLRTDATSGEVLNIVPRVLLVPAALESTARTLTRAQNTMLGDAEGDLLVAVDPNLDSGTNGATAWYLAGSPALFDTVMVAMLTGATGPAVETSRPWEIDGVEFRVTVNFSVVALDSKALVRNRGV